MKAYIIRLREYKGTEWLKFVDQETWDWINGPVTRPAPRVEKGLFGKKRKLEIHSWMDTDCPPGVIHKLKHSEEGDVYRDGVSISSTTYDNDRALAALGLGEDNTFSVYGASLQDCINLIAKAESLGYTVETENTYEGSVY